MPWSSLPEHLNSPDKWIGSDNDVWWMRWEILTKGWFAFSPRAKEWWARWRAIPRVLFAIKGKGPWRWEHDCKAEIVDYEGPVLRDKTLSTSGFYLSRVQYWCRWHFAIQWPLQITTHCYWHGADIPALGARPNNLGIKKMIFVYGPTHRDSDIVYWLFSFFIGGQFK